MEKGKENSSNKLIEIIKKLSFTPCSFGFHNYEKIAQGFIYSNYKCKRCGKEDIDN
jgi:hypothetical protein